jgi:hypothetical protein
MRKKVDPIHFFNQFGHALLSHVHLIKRVRLLEEDNARLKRLLVAQVKRNSGQPSEAMIATAKARLH